MNILGRAFNRIIGKTSESADAFRVGVPAVTDGMMELYGDGGAPNKAKFVRDYTGWVFACAELNAIAVAQTPLRLYAPGNTKIQRTRKVDAETKAAMLKRGSLQFSIKDTHVEHDIVEVSDHPVLELLRTVNPFMNRFGFIEALSIYLDLTGEAYTLIVTSKETKKFPTSFPIELWVLPAQEMHIIPDPEIFIKGYKRVVPNSAKAPKVYDPEEIIYMRRFNPRDMWRGYGSVQAAAKSIFTDNAMKDYEASLMLNMGTPDLLVFVKGIRDSNREEYTTQWKEEFGQRGAGGKASGVAFLDGEIVSVEKLGFDPRVMQLDRQKKSKLQEIAGAFHTPIPLLVPEGANKAIIEGARDVHALNMVSPRQRQIEEALNQDLVPKFPGAEDAGLFLAFDSVVKEDKAHLLKEEDTKLRNYSWTINDVHHRRGEEDVPYGDVPIVPMNLVPLGTAPPKPPGGDGQRTAPHVNRRSLGDAIRLVAHDSCEIDLSGDPHQEDAYCRCHGYPGAAPASGFILKAEDVGMPFLDRPDEAAKFARETEVLLAKQQAQMVERIRNRPQPEWVANVGRWNSDMAEKFRPLFSDIVAERGPQAMELVAAQSTIEVSFSADVPAVLDFLGTHPLRVADSINRRTAAGLERILSVAIERGDSIDKIAATINEAAEFGKPRAQRIARTEVSRAIHLAADLAFQQSGVVESKEWLPAGDACEFCLAVAQQFNSSMGGRGVSLGSNFVEPGSTVSGVLGGTLRLGSFEVGGPPLHPNCLLPGTRVLAPGVAAGFKASFSGPAVELVLADGRRICITANHVLLTSTGFAPASALRKGDHVVDCPEFERVVPSHPDDDYGPALIEDVVDSLSVSRGVTASSVPVAPEYLHGDGTFIYGHVDVVAADGELWGALEASASQGMDHLPLCAGWDDREFERLGDLESVLVRLSLAAHGVVCGDGISPSLLGRPASGHQPIGLGLAADSDTQLLEPSADGGSLYVEALSECVLRFPSLVTTTKVVEVNHYSFSGHVYDLQTTSGLYLANGVVSSNCRCTLIPVVVPLAEITE